MCCVFVPHYAIFATPEFDPNEYANTVLAGEPYPPQPGSSRPAKITGLEPAKEDISVAIAKLNYGIDDVSKQIKNVVTTHHEDLLEQAAGVGELSGSLQTVRDGLDALDSSLEKLRQKFRTPYQTMQASVKRLQRLQQVSDVLRRTSRFTTTRKNDCRPRWRSSATGANGAGAQSKAPPSSAVLDGRRSATPGLDYEGERERSLAQAARQATFWRLHLMSPRPYLRNRHPWTLGPRHIPLRSINAVAVHIPFIDLARTKVTADMESMVLEGLSQVARFFPYPETRRLLIPSAEPATPRDFTSDSAQPPPAARLVQNLVSDLSTAVEARIKAAFDVSQISKELNAKDPASSSAGLAYKSRVRQEPTNVTAPQWANALWNRLSSLIEDMDGACVK
ncbi:Golgi transport complex subunit 5-domain-containing protein, partial [Lactarius pseudohatsudake]